MRIFHRLWRDQSGVIATTDLVLLATIVVLGLIVGLVEYRNQVVQEFGDLAGAVGHLNQSYTYDKCEFDFTFPGTPPVVKKYFVAGSSFKDEKDFGDADPKAGEEPPGISVRKAPGDENKAASPGSPYLP